MHLADAFIQSDLQWIQTIHFLSVYMSFIVAFLSIVFFNWRLLVDDKGFESMSLLVHFGVDGKVERSFAFKSLTEGTVRNTSPS